MRKYQEKIKNMRKSPAIRDIWRWSRASHLSILYICILNIIGACSSLTIPIATKGLIDGATGHDSKQLLFYALLMSGAVLAIRICGIFSGLLEAKTNAEILRDLRAMVLKETLKKRYSSLDGFHSGEFVNHMFSDVSIVRNGIMGVVPGLAGMVVSFVGAAVILLQMDGRFILLMIAGGLLGLTLIVAFQKPMKSRHRAVQESEGKLHAVLQEILENLHLIKASCSEERMEHQADTRQKTFLDAQLRKGYFSAYMNNSIYMAFQLSWLLCMLWGVYGIYCGNLTYGMLAAIIQLVGRIQGPISDTAKVAGQIYGTISSAERLKEIMDLPEEDDSVSRNGEKQYPKFTEIKMCEVDFSYGRGTGLILEKVNLRIRPGEFAAVTGISGSGKSTLFQLLLGIYPPSEGEIKFYFENGEIEQASRKTRGLFAYVPQGNTLFSGTLRENLTMFTDSATDEEIMLAAKTACMDRFIAELSDGLDTVIGERGIGLSEGQAQRVAVARALLSGAPILLLDESTSALDEETEAKLLQNIASLKGKTCLIVTHRKAALQICDYRIHIEGTRVGNRPADKILDGFSKK